MTIREFLTGIGLERYADSFEENGIDVDVLPELEESDLPDLGVKLLGHRKKLIKAIRLHGPSSKEILARRETASKPAAPPEIAVAPPKPAPTVKPPKPKPTATVKTVSKGLSRRSRPALALEGTKTDVGEKPNVPAAEAIPSAPAPKKSTSGAHFQARPKRRVRRKQELTETVMEEVPDEVPLAPEAPASRPKRKQSTTGPRIKRLKRKALDRIPQVASTAQTKTAPVAAPKAEAPRKAAKKKVGRGKKQAGFSETQWFMAGAQKDADILEAKAENSEYEHDENITEKDRQEYTLRTPEE